MLCMKVFKQTINVSLHRTVVSLRHITGDEIKTVIFLRIRDACNNADRKN